MNYIAERGSPPRTAGGDARGEGRQWRERLASIKALLSVGTEAACREAIEVLHKFVSTLQEVDSTAQSAETSVATLRNGSAQENPGEAECRLCAQCVTLLHKISAKEASCGHNCHPQGLLMRALKLCVKCTDCEELHVPLLANGILAGLIPVLAGQHKTSRGDSVVILQELALRAVCNISATLTIKHEHVLSLLAALPPLLGEPISSVLTKLAVRVLRNTSRQQCLRDIIVSTGGVTCLMSMCRGECTSCERVKIDAIQALESLATDKDFEDLIVERGAVHAFVDLMRTGVRHDVNAAAYAACANLMDSRAARRVLAVEGGVQLLVSKVLSSTETPPCKVAGWMLVSLSADPDLGEMVVLQGGLPALIKHSLHEDERVKEEAAWAIANLSALDANARPMVEAGVPRRLTQMLKESKSIKVSMQLVWAAANLAVNNTLKRVIGESGILEALLQQVRDDLNAEEVGGRVSEEDADRKNTTVQSIRAVANLAIDAHNRPAIAEADGVPIIMRALRHDHLKEVATRALVNLSLDTGIAQAIVSNGGCEALHSLLRCGEAPRVQHEAVLTALNLSVRQGNSLITKGVLDSLVDIMESHRFPAVQEHAAQVLSNLSRTSADSKMRMITSSNLLRRLSRLDLSKSPDKLRTACKELMATLGALLTPGSRRALLQSSLMPHDIHPGMLAASRAKTVQHRRPSPLGLAAHVSNA